MKYFKRYLNHEYKVVPLLPTSAECNKIHFENEAIQYLKIYFNYGYGLCLIPFRFQWNYTKGVYNIISHPYQKVCCLITSLIGGLYYILKLRDKYSNGERNPAMYFELAYYFCDTLYLLLMFAVFGHKGEEILELFQKLQETNGTFYRNPLAHFKTKRYAKTICQLCLLTWIIYILEIYQDCNWDFEKVLEHFQEDGSKTFGIFWPSSTNSSSNGSKELKTPGIFTFISIFSNSLEKILNAFSDILFVMTVLVFHDLVENFKMHLESEEVSTDEALHHFRWLRDMTDRINHAMSLIIGSYVIGNLPFYATNVLDTFRDSSNIFMRLRYLFYCTYFFPALFFAAKSSKEVEEMIKTWIYKKEHHNQLDSRSLNVVLHEVNGHTIGLSSYGCITVSYGLFGSIVSIIVTYALLKTQFQGPFKSTNYFTS